ncbi:MAG TPA: hypothetical protein VIM01_05285 [Dermatophilaceae bacterium]|jgi:hypothetical protein
MPGQSDVPQGRLTRAFFARPVLEVAPEHIGVAMGAAGSAVAVETSDIALMGDNLLKFPEAISLARRTVANMRQNIAIAPTTVSLLLPGRHLQRHAPTATKTRPQHTGNTHPGASASPPLPSTSEGHLPAATLGT